VDAFTQDTRLGPAGLLNSQKTDQTVNNLALMARGLGLGLGQFAPSNDAYAA